MGLCYDCGFKALTVALALRLPGDCLPLGGPGGTDQHGELAVVEQAERAEQLTADRDRFPYRLWHRHCRLNRIPSASIIGIGLNPSVHFVHRWTEWTRWTVVDTVDK